MLWCMVFVMAAVKGGDGSRLSCNANGGGVMMLMMVTVESMVEVIHLRLW